MANGGNNLTRVVYNPNQSPLSNNNRHYAALRGWTYKQKDRMYRDKDGKLVEQGTHEASLASFDTRTGVGTFW